MLVEAHPTLRLRAVAGHTSAGQTLRAPFPAWDGPDLAALGRARGLAAGLIDPAAGVIVDARSGLSGAGRTLMTESLFSEADESVAACGLCGHRHLPEIEQTARALAPAGAAPEVTFVPH